jgi:hypothetical protein
MGTDSCKEQIPAQQIHEWQLDKPKAVMYIDKAVDTLWFTMKKRQKFIYN